MMEPAQKTSRAQLGQILVRRKIITEEQLKQVLDEQKDSSSFLGSLIVAKGWATEEAVAKILSEQLGLAYIDLKSYPLDADAVALIPESLCQTYQAIPLFTMGDSVTMAMVNPLNLAAIEEFEKVSKKHVRPVFATAAAVSEAFERRKATGPASGATPPRPGMNDLRRTPAVRPPDASGEANFGVGSGGSGTEQVASLKAVASMAPVVKLVDQIISDAVSSGASDIHLEPMAEKYCTRFRIDGVLHDRPELPKEYKAAVISRIKIMGNMDIAEKRLPQDGRAQANLSGRQVDLRVSTFPTIHGEKIVIRILDKSKGLIKLEQLGLPEDVFTLFSNLITRPHGIILVTGPTGAGKTTTLYAVLTQLNRSEKNIMTLEDPVEYELPQISQSQVNVKAGLTFATGLRSMVRQDPDVILIGEIRDKETAEIAIHASLTGHLVFTTLHTNDASSAPARLVDMGVEPFLVSTSLIGVLAQRLVRSLCPKCKVAQEVAPELAQRIGLPKDIKKVFAEKGCANCRQTGFHGRTGLYELLAPNDQIRELIIKKMPAGVIREEACKHGMRTLQQDAIEKLRKGVTSISEVLRVTGQE